MLMAYLVCSLARWTWYYYIYERTAEHEILITWPTRSLARWAWHCYKIKTGCKMLVARPDGYVVAVITLGLDSVAWPDEYESVRQQRSAAPLNSATRIGSCKSWHGCRAWTMDFSRWQNTTIMFRQAKWWWAVMVVKNLASRENKCPDRGVWLLNGGSRCPDSGEMGVIKKNIWAWNTHNLASVQPDLMNMRLSLKRVTRYKEFMIGLAHSLAK